MELRDTIELMTSEDFKDRFKAEYLQLLIRYEKLQNMIYNYNNLEFKPWCSRDVLFEQLVYMKLYLGMLQTRANIENIDLGEFLDGTRQYTIEK